MNRVSYGFGRVLLKTVEPIKADQAPVVSKPSRLLSVFPAMALFFEVMR